MKRKIFNLFFLSLILLKLPVHLFSEEENKPFVILNNPSNSGFGAVFSSVIATLDMYDQGCYAGVKVDLNEGMYLDPNYGPNYWEYFFEPINLGDTTAPHHILSGNDVSRLINAGFQIPKERGYELIQKYVYLKPHIQKKINKFVKKKFKGYFTIGIHHRGTDKKTEASIVPYSTTLFHVNWWIKNLPKNTKTRIFVATDDQNFLDYIHKLYPDKVIFNHFIRSKGEDPIHYNDNLFKNNYQKGEEALIDLLLLSKCDLFLFPAASAFSMTATKFNPFQTAIPLTGE